MMVRRSYELALRPVFCAQDRIRTGFRPPEEYVRKNFSVPVFEGTIS